jgi:putative holliday junction resolvase
MPRIIGLDLGTKRIGVAVSDETKTISTAVQTIDVSNIKESIKRVRELVISYAAEEVVVGLPLNMNASKGPQADKAIYFAEKLKTSLSCRVSTFDERLTTAQGEAILIYADMSRKKRKQNIDKLAAQIMLQAYLDSRKIS